MLRALIRMHEPATFRLTVTLCDPLKYQIALQLSSITNKMTIYHMHIQQCKDLPHLINNIPEASYILGCHAKSSGKQFLTFWRKAASSSSGLSSARRNSSWATFHPHLMNYCCIKTTFPFVGPKNTDYSVITFTSQRKRVATHSPIP